MTATARPLALCDFARIRTGDTASLVKTITEADLDAFAALSGDYNPLHMDAEFARSTNFQQRVAHGMIVASYVSTLIGMHLPGPGALWNQQSFRWAAPVFVGDKIEITLTVTHKSEGARMVKLSVMARNQQGTTVMEGEGSVVVLEQRKQNQDKPITERVALVSGGGRGIGAATALALAEAGAAVVVNYLKSGSEADGLCDAIRAAGGRAIALQADVTDAAAVARLVASAQEEFGKAVDVVVNNAGAGFTATRFVDLKWEEIERQLDTHVRGAFNCIQACLPAMLAQNSGRIVNIGSVHAWNVPPAQWTAFVMAKAALKALTHSLAVELGANGIRVNMVSPGMTETSSIAGIPERLRKVQAMQTPLRRLATPEDIARTVVFLCSQGGDFITGADVPVCGGNTM